MNENKGKIGLGFYIYGGVVIALPGIIGGILSGILRDLIYLEVLYVVFGLVDLLLITVRLRFRDGQNYKKNKTVFEDKKTPEYRKWIKEQYFIALIGFIDLGVSLIVYLCGRFM